jgi:Xaa-Pro aminopeptidase
LVDLTAEVERLRLIKDRVEIERIRRAGRLADEVYRVFLDSVAAGKREFEIVADVEAALRAAGATDNFMLIAAGGAEVRGMTPPRDYAPRRGDLVRTELTPQLEGYWCQICRTCVLGAASSVQKEAFALFLAAEEAGIRAARPGVAVHEVAKAQNDVFRRAGYGEYVGKQYTRVRGHGHGLHFDEAPVVDEGVSLVLEPGMVMVIHPNTYHPGAGYFVLGDPVLITEQGAEILSATPRELFEV